MTIYKGLPYLAKHRILPRAIHTPPSHRLDMVILVPMQEPTSFAKTLEMLKSLEFGSSRGEIIWIYPKDLDLDIENEALSGTFQSFAFEIDHDKPGLMLKTGMDEAVDRIQQSDAEDGLILPLLAGSQADPPFIQVLLAESKSNPRLDLFLFQPEFQDPFTTDVFDYITLGLQYAGYPFAFPVQTGNLAIRSSSYQKLGGISKSKQQPFLHLVSKMAPERIHFSSQQKILLPPLSEDEFSRIQKIPPPQSFEDLESMMRQLEALFETGSFENLPLSIESFLVENNFEKALPEMKKHSRNFQSFRKRFFAWFNLPRLWKYFQFSRNLKPKISLEEAKSILAKKRSDFSKS